MKRAMAVSGLFFIFFVLFHCYGNLKYFLGEDAYNGYAHHLRTMFEPILPYEGLLWILRVLLLVALVVHAGAAFHLWARNNKARGSDKYAVKKASAEYYASRYANRTMRWGGVILLLFIVAHILQFTTLSLQFGGHYYSGDAYENMYIAFSHWWVWLMYLVAVCSLGLHVWHGVWSALQSLGATRKNTIPGIRLVAFLIAAALVVGFMSVPTAILFNIGIAAPVDGPWPIPVH
ncbi:succinate dehydrogenase cytochrome b subunit [Actinomyces vulturis]|uniref:succinate dehydrogenase cytochrome b subunit n=1 Tax=Actinomyces vulturis TaxID=1857645 RepID=UPI0009F6D9A4|nr:succinate dehydrogenase cytochrome b subunit [Actinomyces vulturis]